ncbi:MAG TPA: cytochrome P450 [Conexibacter sp.]|jgi:cytochrome P450|nr:cytochrome P450 [Conexibacter sp.]
MTATISPDVGGRAGFTRLIGEAPPSPSGPAPDDGAPLNLPPAIPMSRQLQALRFSVRQVPLLFKTRRELGETFAIRFPIRHDYDDDRTYIISHPDHVRSIFTAPELALSTAGESPLRPVVGPNSVLTTVGPTHMRQRKLLLPPFHGEAVERYTQMIADVAEREIDSWPTDKPFKLGPRMQAVTLDVIMAGIFGVEGKPAPGTPEHGLRRMILRISWLVTTPVGQVAELMNAGREEPVGLIKTLMARLDRDLYGVIAAARRRAEAEGLDGRTDILSLLLAARDEDGEPMSDTELRDELLTLVLAGHETTANSLAWAFERLLRNPAAYDRLREEVRSDSEDAAAYVEATIHETMRNRPVVPITGRRVQVPWQLGEWRLPENSHILVSVTLLHHREDVYPDPYSFRPERFLGVKPGTYTWVPFGGGIRRCLGATLAMAEQRVVLRAIARRTDMMAPDPRPERVLHRNVTMLPAKSAEVVVTSRRA